MTQVARLNVLQINDRLADRIWQDIEFSDTDIRINIVLL